MSDDDALSVLGSWKKMAIEVVAGGIAGGFSVIVGQPLDTIKVRLQTSMTSFIGPIDCLKKTTQKEGFLALYKGMLPPLSSQIVVNAIVFPVHGFTVRLLSTPNQSQNKERLICFLGGSAAGLAQVSVCCPTELIKCKLQVLNACSNRTISIYRSLGLCKKNLSTSWLEGSLSRSSSNTMARSSWICPLFCSI